jgi:hypothetical protein
MFGLFSSAKPTPQELIDKRRYPRFTTDLIACPLGDVVDVSSGGIRLRGRGKAPVCRGQIIPLTLRARDSEVTIKARAVHIRRVGLRVWEAGFAFVDIRPTLMSDIDRLGRTGEIPHWTHVPPRMIRAEASLPDYYGVLGVRQNAKWEDIRKAFHTRAKKYHPDANPDPDAAGKFVRVIEAYKVLKDPDKRKKYDLLYADRDQHPIPLKPIPVNERRRS